MVAPLLLPLFLNVTFSAPATPLQRLAPLLSQQLGVEVAIDRDLRDQIVLIEAKQLPKDRLLQGIADATRAKWVQDGKRLRLSRPSELLIQLWKEDQEAQRFWMANVLENNARQLAQLRPLDASALQGMVEGRRGSISVSERAGRRVAAAFGIDAILAVRAGERVVFSNIPEGSQRPMPAAVVAVLKPMLDESRAFYDHLQSVAGHSVPMHEMSRLAKPTRTVHAVISRPRGSSEVAIRFFAYGEDGMRQAGGEFLLTRGPRVYNLSGRVPPRHKPSVEAIEWAQVFNQKNKVPSEALVRKLSDPEQIDPVEIALGSALRETAQQKSLIACIPDAAIASLLRPMSEGDLDESVLWAFGNLRPMSQDGPTSQDELLTVAPDEVSELLDTVPRAALKRLIQGIAPSGHLNLNSLAAYEEARPGGLQKGNLDHTILTSLFGDTLRPAPGKGLSVDRAFEARLIAVLNPAQRTEAQKGGFNGPLTDPQQIAAFRRILFEGPVTRLDLDVPLGGTLMAEPTMAPRIAVRVFASVTTKPGWESRAANQWPTPFSTDPLPNPSPEGVRTGVLRHMTGLLRIEPDLPGAFEIAMPLELHDVVLDRRR